MVGGWKAIHTEPLDPETAITVTSQAVWDPDANIHFLRRQENDILYEISFIGDYPDLSDSLNKGDLISPTETMQ